MFISQSEVWSSILLHIHPLQGNGLVIGPTFVQFTSKSEVLSAFRQVLGLYLRTHREWYYPDINVRTIRGNLRIAYDASLNGLRIRHINVLD